MLFEWDEAKRLRLLAERGIDLLTAARIFRGPVIIDEDRRQDYGEDRFVALGTVEGEHLVVVFTRRGEATRLITAWRAGKRARERYQACFPG